MKKALFQVPDDPPDDGASVIDVLHESNMWEWAGVSFGQTETYRIFLAMKKLAETLPAEHGLLKFWGKIYCTKGEYFIIQGNSIDEAKEEVDEDQIEVRKFKTVKNCAR